MAAGRPAAAARPGRAGGGPGPLPIPDPHRPETQWLTALRAWTEQRCAVGAGRIDWYVRDDPAPAALAVGRRSIAVSTGFLRPLYDGALSHRQAVAVLLHEAGHHVTDRCRYGLVVCWLGSDGPPCGMPFTVIAGTFRVVGQTRAGNPSGLEPDGDSIQFRPTDPDLLDRLPILESPVRLTSIGSTQLRMEGIDALEIHFAGSHQPRPLADQGRDALTDRLGLVPITYREPGRTRVRPPAVNDGQPGWIASRSLDVHGRPVAWVFTGAPPEPDGSQVFVDDALAVTSTNHAQLVAGAAYPLFYDTCSPRCARSWPTPRSQRSSARMGCGQATAP